MKIRDTICFSFSGHQPGNVVVMWEERGRPHEKQLSFLEVVEHEIHSCSPQDGSRPEGSDETSLLLLKATLAHAIALIDEALAPRWQPPGGVDSGGNAP